MYNSSNSPRVIYSLSALSEALFALMEKKRFEDITITQLCKKAAVSRKTFYRNCFTKVDLIDYHVEIVIRELFDTVDWTCEDPKWLYKNFFHFWLERKNLLLVLSRQGLFSHFCQVFTRLCCQELQYPFLDALLQNSKHPTHTRRFNHVFLAGGLCQILEAWTDEDFHSPPEELVELLCYLSPHP